MNDRLKDVSYKALQNLLAAVLIISMLFSIVSFKASAYAVGIDPGKKTVGTEDDLEGRDYSVTGDLSADIFIDRISTDYDGGMDAVYKLFNKTQDEINATAIFTVYDKDGKLMKKGSEGLTLKSDEWTETVLTLPLSSDELEGCSKAKAFVWRTSDRKPLTYAVTKTDLYGSVRDTLAEASLFDGFDVELTGDSYLKEQLEIGADYLKYYDVNRLAASLYVNNMSSKSPGQVYGGWEGGGLPGHSVGHYLSACVSMYMQTGDEDFKDRVERLVYLIGEAQYDDGYVGGVAKSSMDNVFNNPDTFWAGGHNNAYLDGMWAPWYSIHKIYGGLIDAYTYMGNEDALRIAQGMADYAKRGTDKLSAERMDYMLEGEYGGINESFAQLYEITGNEDYLVLAKRFSHKRIMDPLSRGEDNLSGLHANTQIPKMIGAAKIYQLTGDEYYKNVAENFWNYVVYDRSYATGGNCDKEFFTDLGTEPRSVDSTETCNVYNMLKLTEYLYSMDPKTEYLEFYENALYNHILGSQNPTGDKTYNIDLTMGGHKNYKRHCQDFSCCEGTGMENPGRFYRMIYTKKEEGLCVNLFINSRLDYEEKGIVLKQTTDFPYSDESVLSFEAAEGKHVPLKIRIPEWTDNPSIEVNGTVINVDPDEDGYVSVDGAWQKGDEIRLILPMDYSLYVSREDKQGKIVAFKYGPILLAGELGSNSVPTIVTDTRDPSEILTKDDSGNLRFTIDGLLQPGGKSITLKPFFEFVSENHMVYWNLYTNEQYGGSSSGNTFEDRLNSATYDMVQPSDSQSETAHNLQISGASDTGTWQNKGWRTAEDASSFSYDLTIHSTSANYLLSVFYGDEYSNVKTRTFDILVDDEVLETYTLNHNRPNDPWEYHYLEIPSRLTAGKDKVTVTYRSNSGCTAGGVFEVRTVSTELYPYAQYELHAMAVKGQKEIAKLSIAQSEINVTVTSKDTVKLDINSAVLGDSEVSVICYAPGWNKDTCDWIDDDHVVYLDQYSVKGGNGSYEFRVNGSSGTDSLKAGGYMVAIGTAEGMMVKDIKTSSGEGNTGNVNDNSTTTPSDSKNNGSAPAGNNTKEKFVYKNLKYKITKEASSTGANGEVTVIGVAAKKESIVIPAQVTNNGYTYKVTGIGAKAFKNNKKVTTVKIGKNIRKIGAGAYSGCKNLKKLIFKTTRLTKKTVGAGAFKGIHAKAVAKVPKKALKKYKEILKAKGMKGKKQKITK